MNKARARVQRTTLFILRYFMRFAFPHGEVTLSHIQPASPYVDDAAVHGDGSTGLCARVEPMNGKRDKPAKGLWSLPWVQKSSSIRPGGKHASQ